MQFQKHSGRAFLSFQLEVPALIAVLTSIGRRRLPCSAPPFTTCPFFTPSSGFTGWLKCLQGQGRLLHLCKVKREGRQLGRVMAGSGQRSTGVSGGLAVCPALGLVFDMYHFMSMESRKQQQHLTSSL